MSSFSCVQYKIVPAAKIHTKFEFVIDFPTADDACRPKKRIASHTFKSCESFLRHERDDNSKELSYTARSKLSGSTI